MKSKRTLFQILPQLTQAINPVLAERFRNVNDPKQRLEHRFIGNETYGRNSRIYISTHDASERRELTHKLTEQGFKVYTDYGVPNVVEVQVTYFQGWHYDV